MRKRWSPECEAQARRLAAEGCGCAEAARRMGVSRNALHDLGRRRGFKFPDGRHSSAPRPNARVVMTSSREAEARRLAADGVHISAAARIMGVEAATLRCWAKRYGVVFVSGQRGWWKASVTEREGADIRLARRKGFPIAEALRIAVRPDLADVLQIASGAR